jgi:hypothetical protein
MPIAVNAFAGNVPMAEIQRLQSGLIRTYTDDFSKYATTAKHKYLREVYASAPRMAGQRYMYSRVNPNIESKFLKEALGLLCDARCLTRICHVSGAGIPLSARINERKFKVALLDVGMMQNALGIQASFDYVIEVDGMPVPVEVKAGARGSLKSMRLFLEEYPETPFGIRYSMHALSYFDKILSIPLPMISQTTRLARSIMCGHPYA